MEGNETSNELYDESPSTEGILETLTHPQNMYAIGAAAALPLIRKAKGFVFKHPALAIGVAGAFLLGYFLMRKSAIPRNRVLH